MPGRGCSIAWRNFFSNYPHSFEGVFSRKQLGESENRISRKPCHAVIVRVRPPQEFGKQRWVAVLLYGSQCPFPNVPVAHDAGRASGTILPSTRNGAPMLA